ncbi:hypothetical protein DAI22_08g167600 [Oryza sativa Japonica Group]|jgi:hypothetical protein|nr:hypothetical protein DAI22_08g167600 [Oryza sativa Japonica Group]
MLITLCSSTDIDRHVWIDVSRSISAIHMPQQQTIWHVLEIKSGDGHVETTENSECMKHESGSPLIFWSLGVCNVNE